MILIGQYDSSFVRRIGIALTLYGIPFQHRPWSIFGDKERLQAVNPLMKVPTLVLDDGTVLVETFAILDHVDRLVAPEQRLIAQQEPARHREMRVCALASGLADLGVSLFYEVRLHDRGSETLVARRRSQIFATLKVLEAERAGRATPYWFGEALGHADIAVAASLRHVGDSHPGMIALADTPALAAHCAAMEALPVFETISQPFLPPA